MTPAELIYDAYPRKVGRYAAIKSIEKAAKRLAKDEAITETEASRKIYKATIAFARSPAGTNPEKNFVCHPTTFYNQGRYLDDPKEWGYVHANNQSKGDAAVAATRRSIEADIYQSPFGDAGYGATGEDRGGRIQALCAPVDAVRDAAPEFSNPKLVFDAPR
jgi:hypothetical protein